MRCRRCSCPFRFQRLARLRLAILEGATATEATPATQPADRTATSLTVAALPSENAAEQAAPVIVELDPRAAEKALNISRLCFEATSWNVRLQMWIHNRYAFVF